MADPIPYKEILDFIHSHKDSSSCVDEVYTELKSKLPNVDIDEVFVREIVQLVNGKHPEGSLLESLKKAAVFYDTKINPHGFDEKVYAQLLVCTKLACLAEGTAGAEINAYKLAVIFGSADKAIHYLKQCEEKNKGLSRQVVNDACLFDLPEGKNWDLNAWRTIFEKNMHDVAFRNSGIVTYTEKIQEILIKERKAIVAIPPHDILKITELGAQIEKIKIEASILEDALQALNKEAKPYRQQKVALPKELEAKMNEIRAKQNQLNQQKLELERRLPKYPPLLTEVELKTIWETAAKIRYKNAKKDEPAAYLFHKYGVPESVFEDYLALKSKVKNSDKAIPPVFIDGSTIGLEDCYLIKLSKDDPKGAVLGHITACCQSSGKAGSGCAHHGMTSENGGFYLLCKGKPPQDRNTKKILPKDIIAQAWAWRGTDGALVLDSGEAQPNIRNIPENVDKMTKMFNALGVELTTKHQITSVRVGSGGVTPPSLGYPISQAASVPVDYNGYRDSQRQREIANAMPLVAKEEKAALPLYHLFETDMDSAITSYHSLTPEQKSEYDESRLLDLLIQKATVVQLDTFLKGLPGIQISQYINDKKLLNRCDKFNNQPLVSYLVAQGANIESALKKEIFTNQEIFSILIDELIKSSAINRPVVYGKTALMKVVEAGWPDLVKKILDNGADIFISSNFPGTAIDVIAGRSSDKFPPEVKQEITNLLLTKWVDGCEDNIDKVDASGYSVLMRACQLGAVSLVERILSLGPNVNLEKIEKYNDDKETALTLAVKQGHLEVVKLLLEKKIEPSAEALKLACEKENMPMLRLLLQASSDKKAVCKGIFQGVIGSDDNVELVKELISNGADMNDTTGSSPLYLALERGAPRIMAYLLKMGADIHQVNKVSNGHQLIGYSPEPIRANDPNDEKFKTLNAKRVNCRNQLFRAWLREARVLKNFDKPNNNGITRFMFACKIGDVDAVKELLELGANIHLTDIGGKSAVSFAAESGMTGILSLLLERGAKFPLGGVKDRGLWNEHWLNKIPIASQIVLIKFWAEQFRLSGTDVNAKDHHGRSLLMYACCIGDIDLVKELIEKGADVKLKDNSDRTALHFAACSGSKEVIAALLEKGALIDSLDTHFGFSPLDEAISNGKRESVEILLEKGAKISPKDPNDNPQWQQPQTSNDYEFIHEMIQEHQRKLEQKPVKPSISSRRTLLFSDPKPQILDVLIDGKKLKENLKNNANLINEKIASLHDATLLMTAAEQGKVDCVQILLDNNASATICDKNGENPLFWALDCENQKQLKEIVDLLLMHGADPLQANHKGITPLEKAREQGCASEVINAFQVPKATQLKA